MGGEKQRKIEKRWNKIFVIVVIVLAVLAIGFAAYHAIMSHRSNAANQQATETDVFAACSDDNVIAAVRAYNDEDKDKLATIVTEVQKEASFQTNAHCVYVAVLYSVATGDKLSAANYLKVYDALPNTARQSLEAVKGIVAIDTLRAAAEKLAENQTQLPGNNGAENNGFNTYTTPGSVFDAGDHAAGQSS